MADNDTRRLLDGAREYIEGHGWHQGDYFGEDGSVCALGALGAARGLTTDDLLMEAYGNGDSLAGPALDALVAASPAATPYDLHVWNDDPNTTKEDVLLAFKRAAEEES